jgi:hypothetical protein
MPLSSPSPRKPAHTRKITCAGYQREDGLWDIEGHLVDTKPFALQNKDRGGRIQPGEPLHEMWVRLTIDDQLVIQEAEAVTDWAPFNRCAGATDSFRQLIGLQIAPGWNRKIRNRIGGINGCTHINEMLGQVATTAIQSLYGVKQEQGTLKEEEVNMASLHTCYALPGEKKEA